VARQWPWEGFLGDVDRLADFGTMWPVRAAAEHLRFVGGDANGRLLFFCETQLQT
jgi:hypothetical protein